MDSRVHEIAERGIDHPLPFDTAFPGECGAFEPQREMALACRVVAGVSAMLLTVIDELDPRRGKCRVEPREHFSRDRSDGLGVHGSYIKEFNGDEAIEDAWAGRGSAGEMRRGRLQCPWRVQGTARGS